MDMYLTSDVTLETQHLLPHLGRHQENGICLNSTVAIWRRYYFSHFTDEEAEVQRE